MTLQEAPITKEKWIAAQKQAVRLAAIEMGWSAKRLVEAETAIDADPKVEFVNHNPGAPPC